MDCKIIKVKQGSDEWLALRRCRITASRLADVMAKPTTKRYKGYLQEKVLELLGHEAVEKDPHWAMHGKEMEPRAIAAYEWKFGTEIDHDVFCISQKYDWLACSPDGLTTESEYVEFKCRSLYKNYRLHVQMAKHFDGTTKAIAAEERHQVQAGMMVTGAPYWVCSSYYEGPDVNGQQQRKIHRVKVPRDESLISSMEIRCQEFMMEAYKTAELK